MLYYKRLVIANVVKQSRCIAIWGIAAPFTKARNDGCNFLGVWLSW